jgi:transcription antitermination factor NusG
MKPGASREAPRRLFIGLDRLGENVAERGVRDAGFRCFYPRYRKEIVHHRTRKLITRSFPLFATYIFVELPTANAEWVRDCDGIAYLLGCDGAPLHVDDEKAEIEASVLDLTYDETREARKRHKRDARSEMERRFPIGAFAAVKLSHPAMGGLPVQISGHGRKGKIEALVSLFGRLTPCQFHQSELEAA